MKENIEELRANVERTEMAGLKFIATRVACARAALDYIAQLEQTSRAQRTGNNVVTRESALAALEYLEQSNSDGRKAEACAMLAVAAPVAADTEQATIDTPMFREMFTKCMGTLGASGGERRTAWEAIVAHIDSVKIAPPATPADAGAGSATKAQLTDERIDYIARQYFSEPGGQDGARNAIHDALQELARMSTPGAQVTKLEDIEQYRLQMAAIGTTAFGYWKESDGIKPEYDTVPLRDVAKLYAKYEALASQSPAPVTAEPVASIDTPEFRALMAEHWKACGSVKANKAHGAVAMYVNDFIATRSAPADRQQAPSHIETLEVEAKLYRDLTGDAVKLGYDGIVAALGALKAAPADRDAIRDLRSEIMNLPCIYPRSEFSDDVSHMHYKNGHRDARHAAAELVAEFDSQSQVSKKPVAWIRFRSDGGYEGPIMHAAMEEVRKKSGAWTPLFMERAADAKGGQQ